MLETPLWIKILFTMWVIGFIILEAAWDNVIEWARKKYRNFSQNLHLGHRPRGRAA